jgi:hypothetical protein
VQDKSGEGKNPWASNNVVAVVVNWLGGGPERNIYSKRQGHGTLLALCHSCNWLGQANVRSAVRYMLTSELWRLVGVVVSCRSCCFM